MSTTERDQRNCRLAARMAITIRVIGTGSWRVGGGMFGLIVSDRIAARGRTVPMVGTRRRGQAMDPIRTRPLADRACHRRDGEHHCKRERDQAAEQPFLR